MTRTYPELSYLRFKYAPEEIAKLTDEIIAKLKSADDALGSVNPKDATFHKDLIESINVEHELSDKILVLQFLMEVSPDKNVRDMSMKAEEAFNKYSIESSAREDIYFVVRSIFENHDEMESLSQQERRYVEKKEHSLRRSGVALQKENRDRMTELKTEISALETKFARNVSENDAEAYFTREELEGLSLDFFDDRTTKTIDGAEKYLVTTKYPDLLPVMRLCSNSETRRTLLTANEKRCKDNVQILEKVLKLRYQVSKLLGYKTHAHNVLDVRMAKNPETVEAFLNELKDKLDALGANEMRTISNLKKNDIEAVGKEFDGIVYNWDSAYYNEQVKRKFYNVDGEKIKQYFPIEHVTTGLLEIYQKMLGLTFTKVEDDQVWHPDVVKYEVTETPTKEFVGHFYMDLFPRESKYNHAACFTLRSQYNNVNGTKSYPVAAMVANFPKPTKSSPALLKHDDVVTYFHEFGHVMHVICSKVQFQMFSGTRVERDFVECPSQMLENWCWEPEVLKKFSSHYQTGDEIPNDLVTKLVGSRNAGAGLSNLRQLFFGILDMSIHNTEDPGIDTTKLYVKLRQDITKFKAGEEETWPIATFGHLMGGYDSGYYGYMWSLVYAADMYQTRFINEGIDNVESGMSYRKEILEPGYTRDASVSIRSFLGREPNNIAFLKKIGL